jgi:hypothetical protein
MGSGYKDFVAGSVLSEADLDGYLMRQTVMTFASAAARDSALSGVLDEGMVAYLEDVDQFTFYTGTGWVVLAYGGASTSWTPALTAASSNPTLGTGSSATGRYVRQGRLVTAWGRLAFGTSATGAGSGVYYVSLPVAADTAVMFASTNAGDGSNIGSGHVRDSSATSNNVPISVQLREASLVQFSQANGGAVTEAAPFAWSTEDVLTFQVSYLSA